MRLDQSPLFINISTYWTQVNESTPERLSIAHTTSSVPGAMPCDLMMAGFFQVEFQPPANTDQIILFNLEELAKKVGFFAAA